MCARVAREVKRGLIVSAAEWEGKVMPGSGSRGRSMLAGN